MGAQVSNDSAARLARIPPGSRHVHLIGVAGTAMTALGAMLARQGLRVTGSDDQLYEPAASLLRKLRIEVCIGFGPHNLSPPPDLVVVGNVITRANPEAQALLSSAIPYVSMPEAIRHFLLPGKRVLMTAGTHGKTTSAAMMAHVLSTAGRDPSMLVGGRAKDFAANYRVGSGPDFVIEGDEYDTAFFDKRPKFLHYGANGTIVTSIEFDHADIYRDLEHVKSSFRALAAQMEEAQLLVVCGDYPQALEATAGSRARKLSFGVERGEFLAREIDLGPDGARFRVTRDGARVGGAPIYLPIGGRMNVANALGVFVLLSECAGLDVEAIAAGLASFSGVARRQEVVGEAAGVTVIDDFAHHPTAVRCTLDALGERFAGRRLLVAFEPRSNTSRRNVFQSALAESFDRATLVYLAPVYFKENDPLAPSERLDVKALARAIGERGPCTFACESHDAILGSMLDEARAGDVAIFMSNGPFGGLPRRLLAALAQRAGDSLPSGGGLAP